MDRPVDRAPSQWRYRTESGAMMPVDPRKVSYDARTWCAEQVVRMHTTEQDGPAGWCKTCTEDGCENLREAEAILQITLVGEQV